jgi:hypothetical protein
MPLHDYTKHIYESATDSAYIIRFLDYLIGRHFKRTTFTVNGVTAEPLITGVLENVKTKERYHSLAEFYTTVTKSTIKDNDVSLLAKINITKECSVMRIICNVKEDYILEFFDQKYRAFLMYRNIRKRIRQYTSNDMSSEVKLFWDGNEYYLSHTKIECDDTTNPYSCYKLLEAYEDGCIEGLYYCGKNARYLITDS